MKSPMMLTLILVLFHPLANASDREVLLSSNGYDSGGFGGPSLTFTQLNGHTTWGSGGKGAWLVNHTYYLGGGGFNTFLNESDQDGLIQHEGVIFGYIMKPNNVFHFTFELLIGGGQLLLDGVDKVDGFFAAEPQASLSVNLASFMVANVGVSYRYISGSEHDVFTDSKLSGSAININVMFGKF